MRVLLAVLMLLVVGPLQAKEIAGVMIQEVVITEDGTELHLNGAGIRSKFFFDIYIAELYMQKPADSAEKIIAAGGCRRIIMHFLYKEVPGEKLVEGWVEGFAENSDAETLKSLQPRIDAFNAMFETVKKGDRIVLDYIPAKGTVVTVAGKGKGVVEGRDFNDALLRIWLGEKPVNKKLKEQLLSYSAL